MTWFLVHAAYAADVDLFEPSGAFASGEGTLQGESTVLGRPGFSGGVLATYAQDPVVSKADGDVEPAVTSQTQFAFSGGWTVEDLLRITVVVPVYPWVDAPITDFAAGAMGDVQAQIALPLWASSDGLSSFGLVPRVAFPTATDGALVSNGFSGGLVTALAGRVKDVGLVWNADLHGAQNEPLDPAGVGLGSTLGTTAGLFWQASDAVRVGGEMDFDLGLASGASGTNNTGAAHAFVQSVLPAGVGLSAGVGTGLLDGIGSPAYRVFGAFTYRAVDRDPDQDKIFGKNDQCPLDPEDYDEYIDFDGCPELDNDKDTIVDLSDLCPDEPEDLDGWDDADGCPDPDNDLDSLVDADDACPIEAGPVETKGCPDQDKDSIVDSQDACPTLPGLAVFQGCPDRDNDKVPEPRDLCPDAPIPPGVDPATSDGCPPKVTPVASATVFRQGNQIVITERVEFDLGKSTLRSVSFPLLQQVAKVLAENVDVKKVEVQGHTDNVGSDELNQRLSQSRAQAVLDYLVGVGVAKDRLEAKGYGESTPMFSNKTSSGRDQNRRVQFLILDAGPTEQAVPRPAPAPAPAPRPVPVPVPAIVPVVVPPVAPTPTPTVAGAPGTLEIVLPPNVWGTVQLDGTTLDKAAPFSGFSVAPGEHTIRVQNSRLKLDWSSTFVVQPGKPVRLAPMGEP